MLLLKSKSNMCGARELTIAKKINNQHLEKMIKFSQITQYLNSLSVIIEHPVLEQSKANMHVHCALPSTSRNEDQTDLDYV